jgi:hypothetical protein
MTIGAISPVLSRIAAIQTRIGAAPSPPPAVLFADELQSASAIASAGGSAPHTTSPHTTSPRTTSPHGTVGVPLPTPTMPSAVRPAGAHLPVTDRAWRISGHDGHVDHASHSAHVVVPDRAFGLPVDHGSTVPTGAVPAGTPYAPEYARAAAAHGVPGDLLAAVGWVESRYQPDAVSSAGAIGVMQLMPFVADELGVDARNPVEAIDGAARLLASHFDRFGSWSLALGAYFSGAGAVSRAGNELPSPRAVEYVRRVHERMEQT